MIPVTELTEEQAALELAQLRDAELETTDELEHYHWLTKNGQRVQQLELRIQHLQNLGAEEPAPEPPQEKPNMDPHEQKLEEIVQQIIAITDQANTATAKPEFERLYRKVGNLRYKLRDHVKDHKLATPKIPPMPIFIDMQKQTAEVCERQAERLETMRAEMADTLPMEKAGPGPYTEPEPAALAEALAERGIAVGPSAPAPTFCAPGPYTEPDAEFELGGSVVITGFPINPDAIEHLANPSPAPGSLLQSLQMARISIAAKQAVLADAEHHIQKAMDALSLIEKAG